MSRIISVVNQKGGVGKTTTVINVGAALAQMGKKVLLVDLDPHGNLSAGLNIDAEEIVNKNSYSALVGINTLAQNIVQTAIPGLDVVPADNNLAGAEIELVEIKGREFQLKNSITDDIHAYDFIMIDCPPSLGLLTLNALCASDSYLVPLQSEFFAMQGLTNILRTTELVRRYFNPKLAEEGILLTMFDSRSNLSKQVYNEIRAFAPQRVFANVIPRRVRLAESTSHGIPGIVYDPSCFGSRSYIEVAKELMARSQGLKVEVPKQSFIPPDPVDRFGKNVQPAPAPSPEV
jgi:chromosome partitioning protein